MKARVTQVWLRDLYEGDKQLFEVIVRIDTKKGKFIEGIYTNRDQALSKLRQYRRSYALIDEDILRPTI